MNDAPFLSPDEDPRLLRQRLLADTQGEKSAVPAADGERPDDADHALDATPAAAEMPPATPQETVAPSGPTSLDVPSSATSSATPSDENSLPSQPVETAGSVSAAVPLPPSSSQPLPQTDKLDPTRLSAPAAQTTVAAGDVAARRPAPAQPSVAESPAAAGGTPVPPPLGPVPQNPQPSIGTQGMPLPPLRRPTPTGGLHPSKPAPVGGQAAQQSNTPLPPLRRPAPAGGSKPTATGGTSAPLPPVQRPTSSRGSHPTPVGGYSSGPAGPQAGAGTGSQSDSSGLRRGLGCMARMLLIGVVFSICVFVAGFSYGLVEFFKISSDLPDTEQLQQKASQFETTRILDRNGHLLYEILDPNAGRRTYVKLDQMSPYVLAATIATEDKSYYNHPGFDWWAIVRAFWQNAQGGETVSGASTITQQLARALLFDAEERGQRTYMRKVREALAAAELTRRYTKDEILELYLNEIYYGNLAYGIEAAAETYFGTDAAHLTMAQASFLAGLPQAPAVYDVYTNRDVALGRMQQVLTLMYETSREQNCIYVSNQQSPICVGETEALAAYNELKDYQFHTPEVQMRYPHWVTYIKAQLEAQFDPQTIYRSGFQVYTTLDPDLQDAAQQLVGDQVAALAANNATNGALVAIRPATGEILAMVGSADFYNADIDGQVNMATTPTRQPGSSIKPFTYLAAFEKGWTPATLIWDVPTDFPPSGDPNDPRGLSYSPVNYDGRFHGPVLARAALANSFNIPAVKTLQFVGIYDDPNTPASEGLIGMAKRLGITTLTRPDYGLALTLGGGEVSLLEMTGAYSVLANGGRRMPPVSITKITDYAGNVKYEYVMPGGDQVVRPEHVYLISNILSDNDARAPMFGSNSVLALPFVAAAKTGTTNDFRDNWTLGYTPDLAVGVWVGNADYTPMVNTTGLTGAAPIWADFMEFAVPKVSGGHPTTFDRPAANVIDRVICAVSGTEPSTWCPSQRGEVFAAGQPPLPAGQDLWSKVNFDTWTNLRASGACGNFTEEKMALNVTDPFAVKWILESSDGRKWASEMNFPDDEPLLFAPQRECRADDPRVTLSFSGLSEGQTITTSPLDINAMVDATADFDHFHLEYGLGHDPDTWYDLFQSGAPYKQTEKIYTWDLLAAAGQAEAPIGEVTLRLRVRSTRDTYAELRIHLNIQVATPTPTATLTPTTTPTLVPTGTPTLTPTITPTSPDTPTPTATPSPTPTEPFIPVETATTGAP